MEESEKRREAKEGSGSLPLIDELRGRLFPNQDFTEARLKAAVRAMTEKIQKHVAMNPEDIEVLELVKNKLEDMGDSEELFNARTLRRFLQGEGASAATANVFKAFLLLLRRDDEKAKERERLLSRVEGIYHVFAAHHTTPGTFQSSLILIDKEGTGYLKYLSRKFDVKVNRLETKHLGNSNLLLEVENGDFPLLFYIYLGPEREAYPFYQAAYIYSNSRGNTVSNLAVFQRVSQAKYSSDGVEAFFEGFEPQRELKKLPSAKEEDMVKKDTTMSVRDNIQYFLKYKTHPNATALHEGRIPFDFRESVSHYPGSNFPPAKSYDRKLIGFYYVYFTERFSSLAGEDMALGNNVFFSTIGRGIIRIYPVESSGVLRCEMRTNKSDAEDGALHHKGLVVNDQLDSSDYMILSMYLQPKNNRYINLQFKVVNDSILIGGYNISYSSPGQLGAGTAILVKHSTGKGAGEWPSELKPSTLNPLYIQENKELPLERRIINLLSRKSNAQVAPPSYETLKNCTDTTYHGLYYLYRRRIKAGISKSGLIIYRNGAVRLIDPEGYHASGEVEQIGNALNIHLRYDNKRSSGFCCIRVDGIQPREGRSLYAGNYTGISLKGDERPFATKFAIEFITGKDELLGKEDNLKEVNDNVPIDEIPQKAREILGESSILKSEGNFFEKDERQPLDGEK